MSVAMPAAVTLRDLTVSYRGHPAVHHLSGAFMPGVLTAVVGPNGAGKSSLLGAMDGTVHDFEGGRRAAGLDKHCHPPEEIR